MRTRFLVPALLAFSVLAVPAFAQGYYDRQFDITGAQMTDWPSSRANTTISGDFLRPSEDKLAYEGRYYRHHYARAYYDRYYDPRYDNERYFDER
jgi:hypothetical protein